MSGLTGNILGAIGGAELGLIAVGIMVVVVIVVVLTVLSTLVQGGSMIFWLRQVRGQDASLNHTAKVTKFFVMLLFTNILLGLAYIGGFFLLIIPCFIFILGFQFASYVVIDKNLGYINAMKASWRMTDGYKFNIFVMMVLIWLLNIGGLLACCVGMVVTNAVGMGAMAIVYNRLAYPGNAYADSGDYTVFE